MSKRILNPDVILCNSIESLHLHKNGAMSLGVSNLVDSKNIEYALNQLQIPFELLMGYDNEHIYAFHIEDLIEEGCPFFYRKVKEFQMVCWTWSN